MLVYVGAPRLPKRSQQGPNRKNLVSFFYHAACIIYKANMAHELSDFHICCPSPCTRKIPSLPVGLGIIRVRVVHGTAQFHEQHLEVLRVGVPRFIESGRNHHVGPQGVRDCDFWSRKLQTFRFQKTRARPGLSCCSAQNGGAIGGALSSSATCSLWPTRPVGGKTSLAYHWCQLGVSALLTQVVRLPAYQIMKLEGNGTCRKRLPVQN